MKNCVYSLFIFRIYTEGFKRIYIFSHIVENVNNLWPLKWIEIELIAAESIELKR